MDLSPWRRLHVVITCWKLIFCVVDVFHLMPLFRIPPLETFAEVQSQKYWRRHLTLWCFTVVSNWIEQGLTFIPNGFTRLRLTSLICAKPPATSRQIFWVFPMIRRRKLIRNYWKRPSLQSFLVQVQDVFEGIRVERQEVPLRTQLRTFLKSLGGLVRCVT